MANCQDLFDVLQIYTRVKSTTDREVLATDIINFPGNCMAAVDCEVVPQGINTLYICKEGLRPHGDFHFDKKVPGV